MVSNKFQRVLSICSNVLLGVIGWMIVLSLHPRAWVQIISILSSFAIVINSLFLIELVVLEDDD